MQMSTTKTVRNEPIDYPIAILLQNCSNQNLLSCQTASVDFTYLQESTLHYLTQQKGPPGDAAFYSAKNPGLIIFKTEWNRSSRSFENRRPKLLEK